MISLKKKNEFRRNENTRGVSVDFPNYLIRGTYTKLLSTEKYR